MQEIPNGVMCVSDNSKQIFVLFSPLPKTKVGSSKNIERTKKRLEKEEGESLSLAYSSPPLINYREIEKMCLRNFVDSSLGGGWIKRDSCVVIDYLERAIRGHGIFETPMEQVQVEYGVNSDCCFLVGSTRTDLIGMKLVDLYYMCSAEYMGNINYILVMALSDGNTVKRFCLDGHKIRPYGEFPADKYEVKMVTTEPGNAKEQFAEYVFHHFAEYDTQPMDCVQQIRGWY